jgi:hypothetical protein
LSANQGADGGGKGDGRCLMIVVMIIVDPIGWAKKFIDSVGRLG